MNKRIVIGALLLLTGYFTVMNAAYARWVVPLLNPGVSEWGCSIEQSEVKKGIEAALMTRAWTVSASGPGYVQGKIIVRGKHTLIVNIEYSNTNFEVKYKSSNNLKYSVNDAGVAKIHPNANSWMKNLSTDINNVLKINCK